MAAFKDRQVGPALQARWSARVDEPGGRGQGWWHGTHISWHHWPDHSWRIWCMMAGPWLAVVRCPGLYLMSLIACTIHIHPFLLHDRDHVILIRSFFPFFFLLGFWPICREEQCRRRVADRCKSGADRSELDRSAIRRQHSKGGGGLRACIVSGPWRTSEERASQAGSQLASWSNGASTVNAVCRQAARGFC